MIVQGCINFEDNLPERGKNQKPKKQELEVENIEIASVAGSCHGSTDLPSCLCMCLSVYLLSTQGFKWVAMRTHISEFIQIIGNERLGVVIVICGEKTSLI